MTIASTDIVVDLVAREATVDGVVVPLTNRAFRLLILFAKNRRRAISRSAIAALWKFEPSDDVINHAVSHLRKVVGDCIVTLKGYGYRFDGQARIIAP